MKHYLLALVALVTFGVYFPCQAQDTTKLAPKGADAGATANTRSDKAPSTSASAPSADSDSNSNAEPLIIEKNQHSKSVSVNNMPLIVKGHIDGDIDANNSTVTIESTGAVSGVIRLRKGTLVNHSDNPISVSNSNTRNQSVSSEMVHISGQSIGVVTTGSSSNWFSQQLALLILGLLCGGVLCATAPVATRKVSNAIDLEPARCLIIGGAVAIALGMIMVFNANLISSPMRLFSLAWSPFGFGLSVVVLGVLAFSWVCGLRHLGNYVAQRTGRESDGTLFGRLVLGMSVLFAVSLVVGSLLIPLAVLGLLLQGLLTVMGLGASVITGFGREANWLGATIHRGPNFGKR